jgi:hypothetical protein
MIAAGTIIMAALVGKTSYSAPVAQARAGSPAPAAAMVEAAQNLLAGPSSELCQGGVLLRRPVPYHLAPEGGRAQGKEMAMGLEQTVTFGGKPSPAWADVVGLLARHGFAVQLRMIDGELAFPDETPPEAWRELRLGTPAGMVTVRRQKGQVVLVVWGNADAGLLQDRNVLAWAFAEAAGGQILTAAGPLAADVFLHQEGLAPILRIAPKIPEVDR